jgi:hypothetical protein
MVDEIEEEEFTEEGEYQLKTKLSWEIIILEELRSINHLIVESGRAFNKQNVFMLKEAIDSMEQSLAPLQSFKENMDELTTVNDKIKSAMDKLFVTWTIENYTECIMTLVEKKGVIVRMLARAGKYMPITTFLYERLKKEEKEEKDVKSNTEQQQSNSSD